MNTRFLRSFIRTPYRHINTLRQKAEIAQVQGENRVIFSGIQPTGIPHLGNYLGALKQWVELQNGPGEIYYCVVDLHALTVPPDTSLQMRVLEATACLLACGVDPKRSTLFQQSHVKEHALLSWVLGCLVQVNTLKHLTQWKDKSKASKNSGNLGLFTYPVLQCADILLYKATHVPAGADQTQNVELCREVVRSFNRTHGVFFPEPRQITDPNSTRIRSLRDPFQKMSKSDRSELSKICLTDSDDDIWMKMKKAVTDSTSEVTFDPIRRAGVANLIQIHSCVTGMSTSEICDLTQKEKLDTGQYKMAVAEAVIDHVRPIRTEYEKLLADGEYLNSVLRDGAAKASVVAEKNWNEVHALLGLR